MTWSPDATVTINGVDYTAKSLVGVSISYGRTNIWEQARASYATVEILNLEDIQEPFNVNQTVVIKVKGSTGSDITVFTGKINDITNATAVANNSVKVSVHRITAIGPFAAMARVIDEGTYSKEYDDDRLDRIFTAAGVTVDVVDTPGVYEFTSKTVSPSNTYQLASFYAGMAFGYIYETTDGKVGYANESRRTVEVADNGFFDIPTEAILTSGITSQVTLSDLANDIELEYKANATVTGTNASSISTYGRRAYDIITELEQMVEAQNQLDRYLTLRSVPRTNLSSFTVQLDITSLTNSERDGLLGMYMGKPIRVSGLPTAIFPGTYSGFVEGWNMQIGREQATITLQTTEAALSLVPTRWQDVSATEQWEDVGALVQWPDYE